MNYANTHEELSGPTVATVTRSQYSAAVEVQNNGADPVYLAVGADFALAVGKGRVLGAGETWPLDCPWYVPLRHVCANPQVSGAALIITELP